MNRQMQLSTKRQSVIAMLLVAVAMILGGGGSPAPLQEMLVQVCAALLVMVWAMVSPRPIPPAPGAAWAISALLVVLPLVQLVPLPPAVWQALPGRETERAALALVGAADTWQPWSVAPSRTLASLLALAVPAAVLLITASLGRSGRTRIMAIVAIVALASLLIGAGQLTGGEGNAFRFYVADVGYLNGFQANHNSAADVLLIGMVAFAGTVREWQARRRVAVRPAFLLWLVVGGSALFSLGVFLTASRAGIALLPVAWLGVAAIARPWFAISRKGLLLATATLFAFCGAGLAAVLTSGVGARVLGRFTFVGEFRPELWRDSLFAAQQYFPFGSGIGTFVPVFMAIERLEVVDQTLPNRAHNDLLELAVEAGVFGLIVLAAIMAVLGRRIFACLRNREECPVPHMIFAVTTLGVIALHSQVDYPLRSLSLACIAAAAAALLMPASAVSRQAC